MKLKLPEWMQKDSLKLPPWAKVGKEESGKISIKIEVDSKTAYEYWLALLGNPPLSRYWLECAYQCAKLDLQAALSGTKYDPKVAGMACQFNFSRAPEYAQDNFPAPRKGEKGPVEASKGQEARGHYIRIRGSLPV